MSILAASGDIGGGRALFVVLEELVSRNCLFSIIENGFLAKNSPAEWHRIPADSRVIESIFADRQIKVFVFTSSIKDTVALRIARVGKKQGAYIVYLLDNWMNYRQRLEMDGQTMLVPDKYVVMDDLAFEEACADGIPRSVLDVAGQPVLAQLGHQFEQWNKDNNRIEYFKKLNFDPRKKLIAFISEPAEADHGSDATNPLYRGYTEKTVLKKLCSKLQPFADKYQIALVPHPREDVKVISKQWQECSGELQGGIVKLDSGRQAIFLADGIAGMASILLYEAWLLNKSVISLQPGLCKPHLDIMQKRNGVFCVTEDGQLDKVIDNWLVEIDQPRDIKETKNELKLHMRAPELVADIIMQG